MVVRPRHSDEVRDAIAIARAQKRSIRVMSCTAIDGGAPSAGATASVWPRAGAAAECLLDLSALRTIGPIDDTSRIVEIELGIAVAALATELETRGYTIGRPIASNPRDLLYHYVAEVPDLWQSPRAQTLRDRIVAVRGFLADGSPFATRDSPRAASGPLFDRLLTGGAPRLVPAILTHATFRIDPVPKKAPRVAFHLDLADLAKCVRAAWPHTVEVFGLSGSSDVVVVAEAPPPGYAPCEEPPPLSSAAHRRARWSEVAAIPRPFWGYRVDRWGLDAVVTAAAAPSESFEPVNLSAIDPDALLRSAPDKELTR